VYIHNAIMSDFEHEFHQVKRMLERLSHSSKKGESVGGAPSRLVGFWATICKTVRPMLSVRCLSVLSVLSVTFVHCGQTVGRIKMKLGMQVGLGPGHIVLGRDPAPLP